MKQQDISLLMKISSTGGNYISGEEKYTFVWLKHGNSTDWFQ